jgi:hypothetical protein
MATDLSAVFDPARSVFEYAVGGRRCVSDGRAAVVLDEPAAEKASDPGPQMAGFFAGAVPSSAKVLRAKFGASISAALPAPIPPCPECARGSVECDCCEGSGRLRCARAECTWEHDCDRCDGDGQVDCPKCGGVTQDDWSLAVGSLGRIPLRHARILAWFLARGGEVKVWTTREVYGKDAAHHAIVFKRGDEWFVVGELTDDRSPSTRVRL